MKFDIFTALAASCSVIFVLGITILLFWRRDTKAVWLAWWGAAFAILAFGNILVMARPVLSDIWTSLVGSSFAIAGFGAAWQAARVFERRRLLLWPVLAAIAVWGMLFFVPAIRSSAPLKVIVTTTPIAAWLALTAWELWRGRDEVLPSRFPAITVYAFLAAIFVARIPAAYFAPYPMGGMPIDPLVVVGFNVILFVSAIVLTVLLISMTLERLELNQRTLAHSDPLTGLLNRRALEEAFGNGAVAARTAVILFDLDRFKRVNDMHGHAAGDELLRRFTQVCRENLRQVDLAARLGGEEFAVILPGVNGSAARLVAERIRRAFAEISIEGADGPINCTVSAGIEVVENGQHAVMNSLLQRADRELYRAKRSGRNRVCMAQYQAEPA